MFLQAFVVQTHVHGAPALAAGIEQHAIGEHEQHVTATAEHRISCSLCQVLSSAGAATLPGDAFVLAAERASEAAGIALALAPRVLSHSWRSRAPPALL